MGYLQEAYLVQSLSNFQAKITERESRKKYYFRDTGIQSLFLTEPESILLETMVHNHLRRNYAENVFYLRDTNELDFYVPGQALVQACYTLRDYDTRKREISALQKAGFKFPVPRKVIVTWSDEEIIPDDTSGIHVIPVWRWLLEDEY
jgi:predicted AAA+ superfamily ATPase